MESLHEIHVKNILRWYLVTERIIASIQPSVIYLEREGAKFEQDPACNQVRTGLLPAADLKTLINYVTKANELCKEKDIVRLISSPDTEGAARPFFVARRALFAYYDYLDLNCGDEEKLAIKEEAIRRCAAEMKEIHPDFNKGSAKAPVENITEEQDFALALVGCRVKYEQEGKPPVVYFVENFYIKDGRCMMQLTTVGNDNVPPVEVWKTGEEVAKMEEVLDDEEEEEEEEEDA